ncbi:putative xylanase/chitin deacetylase [Desulfomonile tiedjei DSM 6799]|uniref:Putative xylanase/chitin deacetylase n=2 Tax=Desulfomonile tiedjei TaxID=2358 RepID=I4C1R1_DESTA|nr:putative xylanase/chitin deacetylase [Desulfomonile tiedjei DSM 6799]
MTLSGAGMLYRASAAYRNGFRILTYHGVEDDPTDSYSIKSDHFRYHMAYLSDHYRVIDMSEYVECLNTGHDSGPNTIAVTFDDGYRESCTTVAEILQRHNIPATFFLVTDILDNGPPNPGREFLSWSEARAMVSAGFSFGSHTVSHRSLATLTSDQVVEELVTSGKRIEEELGVRPIGISYPYGTVRDIPSDIAAQASRAGYSYGVTALHGLNRIGLNPFLLRRTSITAGDGPRTFRMILKGNLDPWCVVDKWGYRLQRQYDSRFSPEKYEGSR